MADKLSGIGRALKRAKQLWPDANEYTALAYHAGCTPQAVYKWESIGGIPTTRHAQKVSELTGVPVADLVPPLEAKPHAPAPRPTHRTSRASQKKATTLSVVEAVHGSKPAIGEMGTVQRGGEPRVGVVERPADVLQRFAAAQQRRREPVAQGMRTHPLRQAG
jgi:hypothetical protein